MDTAELYKQYWEIGAKSYKKGDEQSRINLSDYKKIKEKLFESMKEARKNGEIKSERADEIAALISEESADPISYWGSEKIARTNHLVFLEDMQGRMFDALINAFRKNLLWKGNYCPNCGAKMDLEV